MDTIQALKRTALFGELDSPDLAALATRAVERRLQHAANCVMIATDLHNQGEILDAQIADARTTANEYETTTNTLLNKISTVLAAEK